MQAIGSTRPGGHVGYVGVARGVELPGEELFFSHVHLHGGPDQVRRFLPELIDLIWTRQLNPERCSTSNCRSPRPRQATRQWTSAERSRFCCVPEAPERTPDPAQPPAGGLAGI